MQRYLGALVGLLLLLTIVAGLSPAAVAAQDATPVPTTTAAPPSTSGVAATGAVTAAQQQLADKYAPIAMLKAQSGPATRTVKAISRSPVDFLFDNPDIALKANGDGDPSDGCRHPARHHPAGPRQRRREHLPRFSR